MFGDRSMGLRPGDANGGGRCRPATGEKAAAARKASSGTGHVHVAALQRCGVGTAFPVLVGIEVWLWPSRQAGATGALLINNAHTRHMSCLSMTATALACGVSRPLWPPCRRGLFPGHFGHRVGVAFFQATLATVWTWPFSVDAYGNFESFHAAAVYNKLHAGQDFMSS
eukprot:350848-Chlamydomonas_euryale.AAC.12